MSNPTEDRAPARVQLSRRGGWRIPENTIKVSRGTSLGNPFRAYEHCKGNDGDWGVQDTGRFNTPIAHGWTKLGAVNFAITCYKQELEKVYPEGSSARYGLVQWLKGKNLACWCPLDQPCHADVLLDIANNSTFGVGNE